MSIKKSQLVAMPPEPPPVEVVPSSGRRPVAWKGRPKKWPGLVLRCMVTLCLFAFLFRSLSWPAVWSTMLHIHRSVALVGLVLGFYTLVVSAYQWQRLLRTEGIWVDLTKLINLYMVGIAFSHFLPTSVGGDLIKAYYVGRDAQNTAGSASAVFMARITGFLGMVLVAFPALLIWNAHFPQQMMLLLVVLSSLVLVLVGGTFLLAATFSRLIRATWIQQWMTGLLPGILQRKLFQNRVMEKVLDIGNTLIVSARQPHSIIIATLFGVMFHIVACLNYFTYGLALRMDVPFYFYLVAIPLVSLIAFLPVSINGFGLRESALVYIFSTVHVPPSVSLLLAFVMDLQTFFFGLLGGCVYLFMDRQNKRSWDMT